jgi:hypothetical protein
MLLTCDWLEVRNRIISVNECENFTTVCDHDWICDFAIYIAINQRTNKMNINLQGENHLITKILESIIRKVSSIVRPATAIKKHNTL